MLDPNTATFQTFDDPVTRSRVLVGQLGAMQSLTFDLARMWSANPHAGERMIEEAKQTLVVNLWRQIYGQLGGIIEHLHNMAAQAGDLRYLTALQDARALLRPAVQTPALAEDNETAEGAETQSLESLEDFPAFVRRVQAWQEETFKQKTPDSIVKHLAKEVAELSEDHKPSEAADCLLLLIGHAGECGYDLLQVVRDKFAEVQKRQWGPVNAEGFQEHIRDTDSR